MKNRFIITILSFAASTVLASSVLAQENVPDHPRVNEVNQRLENQQNRIDNGVKDGQINARQEMRDEKRDAKISQQESRDEAKHGGHLTKKEQNKLNKELNANSRDISRQRHDAATAAPAATTR